jgi:hypothetical protein
MRVPLEMSWSLLIDSWSTDSLQKYNKFGEAISVAGSGFKGLFCERGKSNDTSDCAPLDSPRLDKRFRH